MNDLIKPNIMMVDDDFDVLFTLSANLAAAGFSVTKFNQPESAVDALKERNFDLVLSDIKMPKITGLDILDAVNQYAPDTPLILMTGYADLDIAMQAIKRGAFDLLTKPVDYELLRIAVGKALKIRNARMLELSYQQRLEDDLLTRTAELRSYLERLEFTSSQLAAAEEAKDAFLSTISHELRTPMNGIVGALSLLADVVNDPEQRQFVDMAAQSATDMCGLVDRIINFTALKTGRAGATWERFSLQERISSSLEGYREICHRRGLELIEESDESVPEVLEGNLESYLLILDSLMNNAVKFTDKGLIRVTVSVRNTEEDGILLKTTIHDTGIGIPADRHDAVFQEFIQAESGLTRAYGGLGIGLNTALLVVQSVGGDLWFESQPDEGSDFHFTFPFRKTSP